MDLGFDLEEPRYTQAQLLRMLTNLKAKNLQNWNQRGILDQPGQENVGKGFQRLYTPIGVIALDFMNAMLPFGVSPLFASQMADRVAEAAVEYVAEPREIIVAEAGHRWIPVRPEMMSDFRRALIHTSAAGAWLEIVADLENVVDRMHRSPVILIELDFIITQALNRMLLLEDGVI